MLFIPEGDLYRLIVSSKLPSAEKFERWVFDEVLPTIRKTGGYVSNNDFVFDSPFAYCYNQYCRKVVIFDCHNTNTNLLMVLLMKRNL